MVRPRNIYTTFTNGGGELYSVSYGNDTDAKNFVYDAHVWISSGSVISNLEMDNNQVMRNGDTVIYAFQCSGYQQRMGVHCQRGNPQLIPTSNGLIPPLHAIPQSGRATPGTISRSSYSRDDSGNVTYHSVWFDGVEIADQ